MTRKEDGSVGSADTEVEAVRERIMRVAAELFAEKGYHATGVAEIGRRANLQRGALYYHIKSKDDLLFEIMHRHIKELVESANVIFDEFGDPEQRLRQLARVFLRKLGHRRADVVLWQREMHALKGRHLSDLVATRDEYEQFWTAALLQGVESGIFKSADPIVVKGLIGMVGYTYLWLRDGGLTTDEVADRLLDMALDGERVRESTSPKT